MPKSVNKVILIGNLGRDAETKHTPQGTAVARFSVATTRSWKEKGATEWREETNWSNVVLWTPSEYLQSALVKGAQVYVEGRMSTRSYDDKDGKKVYATEVIADSVIPLGARGGDQASGGGRSTASKSQSDDAGFPGITDDDVPF